MIHDETNGQSFYHGGKITGPKGKKIADIVSCAVTQSSFTNETINNMDHNITY
jgi:hypothetical protein